MDWYYLFYVSPVWGYMGMETHLDVYKLCISYLLQIILTIVVDWKREGISGMALQVLYMITMTPLLSYYALDDQSTEFAVICTISFIISAVMVRILPRLKSHIRIIFFRKKERYRILTFTGLAVVVAFVLYEFRYIKYF